MFVLQFIVAWKLDQNDSISVKHVHKDHLDSDWTTVSFKLTDNKIQGGLVVPNDDTNQFIISGNFLSNKWVELVSSNTIFIGKINVYIFVFIYL